MIENIKKRISCRTFRNEAIESGKLDELKAVLAGCTEAPFGSRVRFDLFDFEKMSGEEIRGCGTYGVIKGARHFIAGAVVKAERAMEDYGYCLEKIILHATGWGWGRAGWAAPSGGPVLPP